MLIFCWINAPRYLGDCPLVYMSISLVCRFLAHNPTKEFVWLGRCMLAKHPAKFYAKQAAKNLSRPQTRTGIFLELHSTNQFLYTFLRASMEQGASAAEPCILDYFEARAHIEVFRAVGRILQNPPEDYKERENYMAIMASCIRLFFSALIRLYTSLNRFQMVVPIYR